MMTTICFYWFETFSIFYLTLNLCYVSLILGISNVELLYCVFFSINPWQYGFEFIFMHLFWISLLEIERSSEIHTVQ